MSIVTLQNVVKDYMLGTVVVPALKGIDLSIGQGDFVSLAGPSGSGKTTLLNLIGCVDVPTAGEVLIKGQSTSSMSDTELTDLRHDTVGFIFQSFNLIPVLNVFENVEFPLLLGRPAPPYAERKDRVEYLLEEVGLADRMHHKPNELSGGQRQRVAIARALATNPEIVLADEPTANLDSKTSLMIIDLMKKVNQDEKTTFLFSTHDPMITETVDHVIHILDGELEKIAAGVQ
jgi:putative ABC transport system ATP-binding protein